MSAIDTETAGMQALTEGRSRDALELLGRAVTEYRAENDLAGAMSVLGNLAFLSRQANDLKRALALTEEALSLHVPPAEGAMALMNCAGVLDRLRDRRARGVWMLAAQGFTGKQPMLQVFCLAHAIGAELAQQSPNAVSAARALLSQVGPGATPSMLAGFVGAIGESAGPAGVPFLAQSVWVLTSDLTAFNASTQPHWALLVEQLGFDADLAVPLCVLALGGTLARQGQKDFQTLTAATKPVFEACAEARKLDLEAFSSLVQQQVTSLDTLPAALEALVPESSWVLPQPRGPKN